MPNNDDDDDDYRWVEVLRSVVMMVLPEQQSEDLSQSPTNRVPSSVHPLSSVSNQLSDIATQ